MFLPTNMFVGVFPKQSNPFPCGAGLEHVLVLVLVLFLPSKQLVGQSEDHGPQSPQSPSTAR